MYYVYKSLNFIRKGDKITMKKYTKKVISLVLAFVIALSSFAVVSFATEADMAVSVDKTRCLQGETLVATVYFPSEYGKAAAMDLELTYDKTKMELVDFEAGVGLKNAIAEQLNGNSYSVNTDVPGIVKWTMAGSNNFNFKGVFAVITFNVRKTAGNGVTKIDLKATNVANSGYVNITSAFKTAGAEVDIIRDSVNDFVFELNEAKTGYNITAYRCATVSELTIPSYYNGLPVVGIAERTFFSHGELTKVILPEHLVTIGEYAFSGCSKLTEISIPNTVESIGAAAFFNCSQLAKVTLPLGIDSIEPNTFYSCYFLESIEIPFTVESIGNNAFYNCLSLATVKISKNTTEIGEGAFAKCYSSGINFIVVEGNTALPEYITKENIKATTTIVEDISLGKVEEIDEKIVYTGAPIEPEIKVTLDNGKEVADGVDYKVVYVNNIQLGNAKVYVVGIDAYGEGYELGFEVYCEHASVKKIPVKKQTCTENGVYNCKCEHCGLIFKEEVPATGHPSGEWIYEKLPTVFETGLKYRVCTVCGEKYDEKTVADKIYPDVDLDGKVNSNDALIILQRSVGKDIYVSPEGLFNADTNGDKKINSQDALVVLQISVGKIVL